MTIALPLWLQNAGATAYTAQMWRAHLTSTIGQGVVGVGDWKVSEHAAGANMSVDIAAGSAVIVGTEATGQGAYLCSSDAVESVTLDASPSSGQSRIDLVVATVRDSSISGSDDDMIFDKVTGTPTTGTPAVPTVPASSIVLAQVLVAGLVSSVVNANITDRRVLAPQGVQPVASLDIAGTPGQIVGKSDGTAWVAGTDGSWSAIRRPAVISQDLVAAHANFGGGTWLGWAGGEITLAAPGYPCLIVATVQCYVSNNVGQLRLGISTNGGTSYATSPAVYANSTGALDLIPVHLTYRRTSTGSGGIKIQPQGNCSGAGGMGADGGYVTVTVHPT